MHSAVGVRRRVIRGRAHPEHTVRRIWRGGIVAVAVTGLVAALVSVVALTAAAGSTNLVDLGTIAPGCSTCYSTAAAISVTGQVVGVSQNSASVVHAFSWTQSGGMVDLGTLPGSSCPSCTSTATGVNAVGQVVGSSEMSPNVFHAFSWTPSGGLIDLGTLGGSSCTACSSQAYALNDAGVVVGQSQRTANGPNHAFMWTQSGGMVDLGTLGGAVCGFLPCSSGAVAINDAGQIVGQSTTAIGTSHAYSWTPSGGMVDLSTLGGNGNCGSSPCSSNASAVSGAGQVVGQSSTSTGAHHAFSWTPSGGLVDLSTIGGSACPTCSSYAFAVSNEGQVIGESYVTKSIYHGFSWTPSGGLVDLGTLGGSGCTSCTSQAEALNDTGAVVGQSSTSSSGSDDAFLWTPSGGLVDLGTLPGGLGLPNAMNDAGQVAGDSYATSGVLHAVVWSTTAIYSSPPPNNNPPATPLTVTAPSPSMTYGQPVPTITPTYAGFVNGDTPASLTTQPTCATTATSSSPPGTYPTTCTGAADPNYTISYVAGTLTVLPAPLTVTASSGSMNYGDSVPTITPSYSGFVNGDTPASLTMAPFCFTTTTSSKLPGTYPTTCSGAADQNYTIGYVAGTVTVLPAPLTVTASSASMTYGQPVPSIAPSYSGFVDGDTAASLTTAPTCSTTATDSTPGTYPTTCSGAVDPNYTINYVAGTLTGLPASTDLTISASSASMTYGQPMPSITPSYTGFVNGDTPASLGTQPTCTTTATAWSAPGVYPTTCSGAVDPDYPIAYVDGTLTVLPASLTVTAASASMNYGDPVPTITPIFSGFVNGDTPASLTLVPTCSTTATDSTPGTYPTTCAGAVDPDYTISYVGGTLTGLPAADPLTVTASSASMTYGQPVPAISPSYAGFVNSDTPASLSTQATCTAAATSFSSPGTYPTTCTGAADPDYPFSYVAGTLTVLPAPLSITASSATMTYGGPVPAVAPSYTGFVNGDGPASLTTPATCNTDVTPSYAPGTYSTTCTGVTDPDYTTSYVAGSVTVLPASLTVTASSGSMTYGGTLPLVTPSYSGFVNGDAPASLSTPASCTTTATSSSAPGSYPTSCGGAVDPNYTIGYVAGSLAVAPASLTVTASSGSMTYGGTLPVVAPSYSGFVNGDAPASLSTPASCTTTATSSSAPGSYPTSCGGAVDPNYTIGYVAGSLAVAPASLTVTASSGTMTYGQPVPGVTPSYTGFVNGDSPASLTTAPTCSSTATSSAPGTYATSCSGAADQNYAIAYIGGTLTGLPSSTALTITASSSTMTYGQPVPTVTASYSGFVNGDTPASLATQPTCTTTATASSSPGTYPTTCTGAVDPDYPIAYNAGTITVLPAPLTVRASSASMTYGQAVPVIKPKYSGFVNGDTPASLTTQPTCSASATTSSAPGSYTTSCSDPVDQDYTMTYVTGSLTVVPAPLSITASSGAMSYGGTVPAVTPTYAGFVNGDGPASLSSKPTCSTSASGGSGPGSYPTSCGGAVDPDYAIGYVAGSVSVSPAYLTVTASSGAMSYGGTVPAVTPRYAGFVNGDGPASLSTSPTCATSASAGSGPGSYPTSCGGAVDPDYAIGYVAGSVSVSPAHLTITASSGSMTYGQSVPAVTPTYAGFVNGQSPASLTSKPTCSTTAVTKSVPGGYSTTCGGATDANYSIGYVNGSINVSPAHLTITASGGTMVYGQAVPTITPTYSGFVNGDSPASLTSAPVCSTTATSFSSPGTYPTSCTGAVDPDYAIGYVPGTLTVLLVPNCANSTLYGTGPNKAGANLAGKNLQKVNYDGYDLAGATLAGSNMQSATFDGADLMGANVSGTNMQSASFQGANLYGADLVGDNAQKVNLSCANLQGGDLINGSNWQQVNLTGTLLTNASMQGLNLQHSNMTNSYDPGVNLSGSNLQQVTMTSAVLSGANLSGSNLQQTTLTNALLAGANFSGSNMQHTDFTGADLAGAKFNGSNMSGVTWSNTTCPDGTNSNQDGGTCANDLG